MYILTINDVPVGECKHRHQLHHLLDKQLKVMLRKMVIESIKFNGRNLEFLKLPNFDILHYYTEGEVVELFFNTVRTLGDTMKARDKLDTFEDVATCKPLKNFLIRKAGEVVEKKYRNMKKT